MKLLLVWEGSGPISKSHGHTCTGVPRCIDRQLETQPGTEGGLL